MMVHRNRHGQSAEGFTLIELLVVVSIIGLLISILLPVLGAARSAGKQAVCLGQLHQLAQAQQLYLNDSDGAYWRYYTSKPSGRAWWFGFEAGGPGPGTDRPLDKSRAVLASYLTTESDVFNCPSFPYDDGGFVRKFERRAASYGYNLHLGPANTALPARSLDQFTGSLSEVFVFADGVHFDFGTGFNEGHYISYNANPINSGYGHYRHSGAASVQYMDGHAAAQSEQGMFFRDAAGHAAANLIASDGSNAVYGID